MNEVAEQALLYERVLGWCRELGHDPITVTRIEVDAKTRTVTVDVVDPMTRVKSAARHRF